MALPGHTLAAAGHDALPEHNKSSVSASHCLYYSADSVSTLRQACSALLRLIEELSPFIRWGPISRPFHVTASQAALKCGST